MTCRMCDGTDLYPFLDLGSTPPADQFLREDQLKDPEVFYPLQVLMCETCGLAQLGYCVPPEILYQREYPYEASTTRAGREHWARFAQTVARDLKVEPGQLVVDIGSNVGVLLGAFKDCAMQVNGVDPAQNIVEKACATGIDTICDFFGTRAARQIVSEKGQATVITGTNVFAHVGDLVAFMHAVDELLAPRGTLIVEAPYFANLIAYNEYDTIYHEHLSYLSVKPLVAFFARFGMEMFDVQQVEIHGGSFRIFVARKGTRKVSPEVPRLLGLEEETGLHSRPTLDAFAKAVQQNRRDLVWLLHRIKAEGKSVAGVSAPAKGMTLLNYCKIDGEILDFVTEKSALKIGRYTPGAHIKVFPDEHLLEAKPDYALLLAWNFAAEIMTNLDGYRQQGGRFIIPIPTPRIVS